MSVINANTIIPEFREADMGAILNSNPLSTFSLQLLVQG